MEDKRDHERFATEVDATIHTGEAVIPARTRNVSNGGMSFEIDNAIELGAVLRLKLALVFDESTLSEPIELSACVVWCTAIGDGRFQVGTSFTDMTNESRSFLGMFLRFLSEGQQREAESEAPASDEEMFS